MKKLNKYLMQTLTFLFTKNVLGGQYYSTPKASFTVQEIMDKYYYSCLSYETISDKPVIIASATHSTGNKTLYFVASSQEIGHYILVGTSKEAAKNYYDFMDKHFTQNNEEKVNENNIPEAKTRN